MEFRDVLAGRRMVRSYRPEPIPDDVVDRILSAARRAPSAGYSQGQRLVVVTAPETRARLAEINGETERVAEGYEPWISVAPLQIAVCTREDDYHERYRRPDKLSMEGAEIEWLVPYWFVDAGATMMLLLLAAVEEGLAAGFYGFQAESMQEVKGLLAIPADVSIVGMVTIGRPAPDPRWSASSSRATQPRRSGDDVVHWERWNGSRPG